MRIYGIYDAKVGAFLQPFFAKSKGEAIRSITSLVNDPKHNFHMYAEDFTLFELAEFSEERGIITPHSANMALGNFLEFKKEVLN